MGVEPSGTHGAPGLGRQRCRCYGKNEKNGELNLGVARLGELVWEETGCSQTTYCQELPRWGEPGVASGVMQLKCGRALGGLNI